MASVSVSGEGVRGRGVAPGLGEQVEATDSWSSGGRLGRLFSSFFSSCFFKSILVVSARFGGRSGRPKWLENGVLATFSRGSVSITFFGRSQRVPNLENR